MRQRIKNFLGITQLTEEVKVSTEAARESAFFANIAKNSNSLYVGDNMALTTIYTSQIMYVDTRDISETPHLLFKGIWEEDVSKVFQELVEPGDTVIDIGATFGYFGLVAGTKLSRKEGAKLYLIDANPVYKEFMKRNLTVNGLLEISTISQIALAGSRGTLELQVLKDDWASSTFQPKTEFDKYRELPYEVESVVTVEAMTLDQYAEQEGFQSVDMIKLDIEGLEEESYPGMKKLIKNSPNLKMLFEFTADGYKNPKQLFSQIQKDFKYMYCMPDGGSPQRVSTFNEVQSYLEEGWIMLLISKVELSEKIGT